MNIVLLIYSEYVHEILAKEQSNRAKRVLPSIIGEVQSAFIGGRNILDGDLIANDVEDMWKKNNRGGLLLKLDFEKAYDNWQYLISMQSEKNGSVGEKNANLQHSCHF